MSTMKAIGVALVLSLAAWTVVTGEALRNFTRNEEGITRNEEGSVPTLIERESGNPSIIAAILNDGDAYGEPPLTLDHSPPAEEVSADHSRTYDVLYQQGIDHYLSDDWHQCVSYMQLAIKDHKWYKDTLLSCRRDCKAEALNSTPLAVHRDNSQEFYETTIKNALCLLKCRHTHFSSRHHHVAALHVDREFAIRKPYDYLQLCLFKIGRIQDAANAAVTVLAAQPTHTVMTNNLRQYIEDHAADQDLLENLELQEYAREYVRGDHAHSAGDYSRAVEHMEAALALYWRALEDCRLLCDEPFDQGWFPDFVSSVANHYTFTFRCKRKCGQQLSNLFGEEIEDFLASILNYLQYGYQKIDQIPKACSAVESFLELVPADASMLRNKQYYLSNYQKVDKHFVVRKEIAEHAARERYEERLLNFIDTEFVFLEEDRSVMASQLLLQDGELEDAEESLPSAEDEVSDALDLVKNVMPSGNENRLRSGENHVELEKNFSQTEKDYLPSEENMSSEKDRQPSENDQLPSDEDLLLFEEDNLIPFEEDQVPYEKDQVQSEEDHLSPEDQVLHEEDQVLHEEDQVLHEEGQVPHEEDQVLHEEDQVLHEEDQVLHEEDQVLREEDQLPPEEQDRIVSKKESSGGKNERLDGEHQVLQEKKDARVKREVEKAMKEDLKAREKYSSIEIKETPVAERHPPPEQRKAAARKEEYHSQGEKDNSAAVENSVPSSTTTSRPENKAKTNKAQPVLVMDAAQLNGTRRYVVDNLISDIKCKILTALIQVAGERGDGYHRNINPHTEAEEFLGLTLSRAGLMIHAGLLQPELLQLALQVVTTATAQLVQQFQLRRQLYVSYTHLVCRTAKPEYYGHRVDGDMSHMVHVDNCIMYSPTECHQRPPAYTFRDYSAILYLNDDFEGGEFVFTTDPRGEDVQSSVKPKCGRMVGFSAGPENPHGVKAVLRGSRCAMALWFTHDEKYKDKESVLAETLLEKIKSGEIKVK